MKKDKFTKRIKLNSEIIQKISKIERFNGLWQGALSLSPQILGKLKKSVIITSSAASTRIEGAEMSDEQVARLLRGPKSRKPKTRDEQENAGYADLLGRIFDNYKTLKLTEEQILQFHDIMLRFSTKDRVHRGKYKLSDNIVVAMNRQGERVILFKPTPSCLVKKEMNDIISWTQNQLEKEELPSLLVIASFIFEFLAIHPFEDGNGRLSRVLTNLLLLKQEYSFIPYISLEEIIEDHQLDYYLALRKSQKKHKTKNEDISPWLNFFLDVLIKQTEKAKRIMNSEDSEKLLSEKQLQIYNLFKDKTLSVLEIDKKLKKKIPQPTIKQALSRLVKLKLIERIGAGRGTRYKKII